MCDTCSFEFVVLSLVVCCCDAPAAFCDKHNTFELFLCEFQCLRDGQVPAAMSISLHGLRRDVNKITNTLLDLWIPALILQVACFSCLPICRQCSSIIQGLIWVSWVAATSPWLRSRVLCGAGSFPGPPGFQICFGCSG